jgi:serine protease Do
MLDFEQITGRLRRSTVQVLPGGSGIVWDANGLIVTNAHVAAGDNVAIVDASGARSHARVILRDSERDLALLEAVPATSGLPAEIGDSDSLRAGQLVLALGNPLGVTGAVAAGVIHSVGPVGRNKNRGRNKHRWIQADVRLAPGNSGGMLADAAGRLVGITTMIFNGLALAVPVNDVEAFVRGLYLKRTA